MPPMGIEHSTCGSHQTHGKIKEMFSETTNSENKYKSTEIPVRFINFVLIMPQNINKDKMKKKLI